MLVAMGELCPLSSLWTGQPTRATMSPVQADTSQQLLDAAYRDLDLRVPGGLVPTASMPGDGLSAEVMEK